MEIREKLIKLRDEKNISQQEAADMLGVTRQTVSRWEAGKSAPSLAQLAKICRTFGADANALLGCDDSHCAADEDDCGRGEDTAGYRAEGAAYRKDRADDADGVERQAAYKDGRHSGRKTRWAAITALAVLLLAVAGGLAATIVYAVKDARYDASATVWIVSLPQNTPMIVLSVILSILALLIAATLAAVIIKGKKR